MSRELTVTWTAEVTLIEKGAPDDLDIVPILEEAAGKFSKMMKEDLNVDDVVISNLKVFISKEDEDA